MSRKEWATSFLFLFFLTSAGWAEENTFSRFGRDDLKMLGVIIPPKDVRVQERHKGIRFLSLPTRPYTARQLMLLKYFIDRTPRALLKEGPAAIVNVDRRNMPVTAATASGPYVYFDSSSFRTGGFWRAGSLEGIYRGFVHELVHVLQFREAVKVIDMDRARKEFEKFKRQHLWNVEFLRTDLASSFASVTGWVVKKDKYYAIATLKDFQHEQTSNYGKSSLMEDMPETVSLVVIGNLVPLSKERIQWAVNLLGYDSVEKAIMHTFPYNAALEEVRMGDGVTRFDKKKTAAYRKKYFYSDRTHFITDAKFDETVDRLKKGFSERQWKRISFRKMELKNHVRKASMEYRGKWRDLYVEVISYEAATGYLMKPEKTIVTVLSGYHR